MDSGGSIIGAVIAIGGGIGFGWFGLRLFLNPGGWGDRHTEAYVPKFFRIGSVQTDRRIRGAALFLAGCLFLGVGVYAVTLHL